MLIEALPVKKTILGVNISATSYGEVLRTCRRWVGEHRQSQAPRARYVTVTSVHGIMEAQQDTAFRDMINAADVATPDGMPVVWALRSWAKGQNRVYGPNLMLALCGQATRLGHRMFLYGASEQALAALQSNLRKKFPGIQIVGAISPPFRALTPEEDRQIVGQIQASGADIVFVGLSTPKQERWMSAHRESLPGVVMFGVGAAFDFHAGKVKQAPLWMQRSGLEWFFRLTTEPKRLWKRYLLVTPKFIPLWAMQRAGILKYPQPTAK